MRLGSNSFLFLKKMSKIEVRYDYTKEVKTMKYTDFEKDIADFDNGRYEARLHRDAEKEKHHQVDVYDKKKKRTIASIAGDDTNILQQDLGMPTKLGEMITDYAYTPLDERMADEIPADDIHNNTER